MQEKANGLTISQWRSHCSKPYTTLDRMVSPKIHSDLVSFHPRAVIDKIHYLPYKTACNIKHTTKKVNTL